MDLVLPPELPLRGWFYFYSKVVIKTTGTYIMLVKMQHSLSNFWGNGEEGATYKKWGRVEKLFIVRKAVIYSVNFNNEPT